MSLTRSFCKRSFESQIKDAPKFSFDFDDGTVLIEIINTKTALQQLQL